MLMKMCLDYKRFFSTTSSGSLTWKQNKGTFKCAQINAQQRSKILIKRVACSDTKYLHQ